MLQAHAKAVAVSVTGAYTVGLGDERGAIVLVCFLVGRFLNVHDGTVVEVVGAQVHLVAHEVPVAVYAAHPGGSDAVGVSTPAAHSTAHAATAAHHVTHHVAGQVVETAVVGVVGIDDDAYLAGLRELAGHEGTLPAPVVNGAFLGGKVVTAAGHGVTKDAVHHALLDSEVDDSFLFTVVDAGELGLLALFLDDLDLFHKLGRDVLGGQLGIVQEEGLAGDGDLGDGFTVGGDGTVLRDLNTRELLQKVHQHIVVADFKGRCIILHRVLLDDDGVAHCADGSGIQYLGVKFHLDDSKVCMALHGDSLFHRDVAHDFRLEGVFAVVDFLQGGFTGAVRQGIFDIALFRSQGNGCKSNGFSGGCILKLYVNLVGLCAKCQRHKHGRYGQNDSSH